MHKWKNLQYQITKNALITHIENNSTDQLVRITLTFSEPINSDANFLHSLVKSELLISDGYPLIIS